MALRCSEIFPTALTRDVRCRFWACVCLRVVGFPCLLQETPSFCDLQGL